MKNIQHFLDLKDINNKEIENVCELNMGQNNTLRLKASKNKINSNNIAIYQNIDSKIDNGSKSNISSNVNLAIMSEVSEEKK